MAKLPLEVHPQAVQEAYEAFEYYRQHSIAAADRFLNRLAEARAAIQDFPESWPPYLFGTRSYLVRRYPYAIVYHVGQERIRVIAVAHAHRKPGYWVERLTP